VIAADPSPVRPKRFGSLRDLSGRLRAEAYIEGPRPKRFAARGDGSAAITGRLAEDEGAARGRLARRPLQGRRRREA